MDAKPCILTLLPFQGVVHRFIIPRAMTSSSSSSLGIAGASSALLSLLRRLPWAMCSLPLRGVPRTHVSLQGDKPKKRVAIPEYRLCMGGGMTGGYILYIIYVMPKMGEFNDNIYIQPIYKTWKMLEIWGFSYHLHFSILKSLHEKNVVF